MAALKHCRMAMLHATVLYLCTTLVLGNEIVYPFAIHNGEQKRELFTGQSGVLNVDEVIFQLDRKDGPMILDMRRNAGFHAKRIVMRTFEDDGTPTIERHSPDGCYYNGKVAYKEDSNVLLDTCDGLRGTIEDEGMVFSIEPLENVKVTGAHVIREVVPIKDDLNKRMLGIHPLKNDFLEVESDESYDTVSATIDAANDEVLLKEQIVPDIDPVYAKYPATNKRRYCEMVLVIDNAIVYAAINVRLVLVGIEIWTDKNKIPYVNTGGGQLSVFTKYINTNLTDLVTYDAAHYMSARSWDEGVIGYAAVGDMCGRNPATAVNVWSFRSLTGTHDVVSHELGHNFGFGHDSSSCKCLTSRGCMMGGPKSRRIGFSDCNMREFSRRSYHCLNNYPFGSLENVCGNGIIEGSEECDCGSPEMCMKHDKCCEPNGCKLKRSAQCSDFSTPDCCDNCLFKSQGTLCRQSQSGCDLPEYCPGNAATCPGDLYMADGSQCSNGVSLSPGSRDDWRAYIVNLNPPIKARYLRINPVYWKPEGYACIRTEVLTCSADEETLSKPQPISTRNLYYSRYFCVAPESTSCSESAAKDVRLIFKTERNGDCNKPNLLFSLEKDGTLRHNCSGKVVCPISSGNLVLKKECHGGDGQYERLPNFGLRHRTTGSCVEAHNTLPRNGSQLILRDTKDCNGYDDRTKLHFLEADCLLPVGFENRKLPYSALTVSSYQQSHPAQEARLWTGRGWCLPSKASGKKEYLQIDLGAVKTIGNLKVQGAARTWITRLRLYYSNNAQDWTGYASNDDQDKKTMSYCYKGNCMESRSTQCKNLWDPATNVANDSCWKKLNTEAQGYGTCDPLTNKSCAPQDLFCGQLQCSSPKSSPSHEKYGTVYKQFILNGTKCSAASITIPGSVSNDEVGQGMVAEGTKCGDKKMCSNYKCKSFSDLNITSCGLVNGVSCAGRGICNNNGKCHCNGGFDPKTNCEKVLTPDDGNWGQWSQWSLCSAACAGGRRSRSRFCDSPFPAHGGKTCPGVGYEEAICNSENCPRAGSCKILMRKFKASGKPMVDGVYDITLPDGSLIKMYCDMTRDGGGWTLVVSSHTNDWTTSEMVRERNKDNPSMYKDYSVLKYVDQIKDNYKIDDKKFEYRLEAHRRGQWGGIWSAPTSYKVNGMSPSQTNVILLKRFNNWSYSGIGIAQRMPYIIENRLTMQTNKWGSITGNATSTHPAPWIDGHLTEKEPEHIWYWVREGKHRVPSSCMEIKLRSITHGKKAKSGLYEIQNLKGKKALSTFCDMESFGGGWTMVLSKVSNNGWTKETTLSRSTLNASKDNDYSILFHSQEILGLRKEETKFQYMIEAEGVKKWGGVFEGHDSDGLIACNPSQFKPRLLEKFDNWDEQKSSLMSSNPYTINNPASYLTTSRKILPGTDGVLVCETDSNFIKGSMEKPKFVRLWIREGSSQGSCNQIKLGGERNGVVYKTGYYTIKATGANILTVYCDMESGPGAWTLLVTSISNKWTASQVLSRNEDFPSTSHDYSILHVADSIKNLSNNATFKYKLEARTFNHWGGIWAAPREYTFLSKSNKQSQVTLLTQFDELRGSVKNRMPWLGNGNGLLTTADSSSSSWWGTIVASNDEYRPAPWIYPIMINPGKIWYWVNEDDCDPDRMPVDGGLTKWSSWTQCTSFCSQGTKERSRSCAAPKPRCGGAVCDPNKARREIRNCTGKCLSSPIRSFDEKHCVLPETGGCSPNDSTELIWKSGSEKCDLPEAQFIFDPSHGSFVHKCSRKPVCPKGNVQHLTRLQINSNCPKMTLKKRFTRTQFGTIHFGHICIHPDGAWPKDNTKLVFWSGCHGDRLKLSLYKIEHGSVHADVWSNLKIVNRRMADLTSDTRFPSNPTSSGYLDNFDSPYSLGSNYGLRLWSYFAAPESGMYTFYAACDDHCQIFFSPTVYKKDKKKIIDVQGYTSPYQYDKRSSQKSKKIQLEAGKLYYMEGLLLEMGGGDHLSVAVDFPSGTKLTPLSYYYLRAKAES